MATTVTVNISSNRENPRWDFEFACMTGRRNCFGGGILGSRQHRKRAELNNCATPPMGGFLAATDGRRPGMI